MRAQSLSTSQMREKKLQTVFTLMCFTSLIIILGTVPRVSFQSRASEEPHTVLVVDLSIDDP